MNPMTDKPKNMTRVLLIDEQGILQFAFYKDGMFKPESGDVWLIPDFFTGWISIQELKAKLQIK